MLKKLSIMLCIAFMWINAAALFPELVISAEENLNIPHFELTDDEKKYLNSISNEPLKLALTSELMYFETPEGRFGLVTPFMDLLENEWGLDLDILNPGWSESVRMLENSEVDLMGLVTLGESRKKKYYTTDTMYTASMGIYSRISNPLIHITSLDKRTVALIRNSIITDYMGQYIKENTHINYYDTVEEMFEALSIGEVDFVLSTLDVQSELMRYPLITHETNAETILPPQGFLAHDERYKPLINLINRYLKSEFGDILKNDMKNQRDICIMKKAREIYKKDIDYLNANYKELTIYDSGVLYPYSYYKDGAFEGLQTDANNMFYNLTGMEISVLHSADFPEGFITALQKIKENEIIGATSIYFNRSYSNDPNYIYSSPLYTDKLGFYAATELDTIVGKRIATTLFGEPYVDWETVTGTKPIIYGDRGAMLNALIKGDVDAAFLSEMTIDYNYTILGDHSLIKAVPIEAEANIHLIAGSEHEVFVRLYNASHMLDNMIYPENTYKWNDASRNDKYELIRVKSQLGRYQSIFAGVTVLIIAILAFFLIIIHHNYRKFSNYDRQISRMLSAQKNADMLWGNKKNHKIISKGGFPFFKAWGIDIDEFERNHGIYETFTTGVNELDNNDIPFHVAELSYKDTDDSQEHFIRHYTHKLNDDNFMIFALDVTAEKMREQSLSELANTDSLSSLLTRRAMSDQLVKLVADNTDDINKIYMIMFDIDNFKMVNDTYGHDIGDVALVSVAQTIKNEIPNCLASRWGGEEFLVAVKTPSDDEVVALAEKVLHIIEKNVIMVGKRTSFNITVSCGIAAISDKNYEKAVTHADKSLYLAKNEGKNCVRLYKHI